MGRQAGATGLVCRDEETGQEAPGEAGEIDGGGASASSLEGQTSEDEG